MMQDWWVHSFYEMAGAAFVVSWIFWVILSITLHELAHGWTAEWQGDRTPSLTGHLTIDPLVHIPGFAWIMFALVGITWGLMPVDPTRFRSKYGDFIVSGAGPAMNLVLGLLAAIALGIVLRVTGTSIPEAVILIYDHSAIGASLTLHILVCFFFVGGTLNFVLAIFNLLPIPPLDGSHMLADVWHPARVWFSHPNAAFIGLFVMVVLVFGSGAFDWCYGYSMEAVIRIADLIAP